MRYWFDTEFLDDGRTIELISIGVVSGDGREYYAETPMAVELCHKSEWLKANVLPHLNGQIIHRQRIARELVEFVGSEPEIWAYYADYDWVALCQLYGRMIDLPKGWPMFCRDLKQAAWAYGDPKLPKQEGAEHNALADARWTRDAWLWLRKQHPEIAR
jgi:hypothetical protein